ncbi:amino acid permease [Shewanella sp. SR43-4]|uniref:Aromatic amino acid transport family protein n=1 Tax=Shewanella vesiculosa TaxID=518738 RepID=A0ABV0FQ40_9GAMM|nr:MULTISPECIES: aromatic amino acid transport family protein [Shewanella]NCQ44364.1 amino acid permease [Shewanella frigidimarina]MBB1319119.1 amino acid permease [Shewanella sp. SR43-4]MBB1322986.1 amino acid permease [Shewanella sp. SR43-8]MBB1389594.1 amino acid permease [Shewanella sp. SG44-6]MBB1475702.1 amino acid permease [Shewanella sp. SG41-3]
MNFKTLGSISIVAGTAIGGGMLALPLATAALGIIPALILLVVIWGLSAYTSLLMLEINLHSGIGDNVHAITGKTLGKVGQLIQGGSFLSLLFALTMVYLMGGSSLLETRLQPIGINMSNQVAVILFTVIFGGLIAIGVKWIDKVSRILFTSMVVLLVIVVAFLLPDVNLISALNNYSTEVASGTALQQLWLAAIPVVFTSFGFHVCIATIVRYLEGNAVSLRKVLLIGSTIPLICYILWLLVTLGSLGGETVHSFGGSLPKLVTALQSLAQSQIISQAIDLFANLALITSFLGVTMSLFDYIAELTRANDDAAGRAKTWLMTFIPPLLCALYYPDGFFKVLGFAAIPLVVMIIFLPIAMALKQRSQQLGGYQVSGGTLGLVVAGLLGILIVIAQLIVALT